jgi:hypothetical protein
MWRRVRGNRHHRVHKHALQVSSEHQSGPVRCVAKGTAATPRQPTQPLPHSKAVKRHKVKEKLQNANQNNVGPVALLQHGLNLGQPSPRDRRLAAEHRHCLRRLCNVVWTHNNTRENRLASALVGATGTSNIKHTVLGRRRAVEHAQMHARATSNNAARDVAPE